MHLQSRGERKKKKNRKSWVEKGWVQHQDHSSLSSWISIIPLHLKKKGGGKNSQQNSYKQNCTKMQWETKTCVRVRLHEKLSWVPGTGNASITSHHHIVWANWSLCSAGLFYFMPRFLFFSSFFFSYMACLLDRTWCQLHSPAPSPQSGGEHGRWRGTTEPSTSIYASRGDLATNILRGPEARRARCRQNPATRCTSPPPPCWPFQCGPRFGGKEENSLWISAVPLSLFFCLPPPRRLCFSLNWLVCLSVSRMTQKLQDRHHES